MLSPRREEEIRFKMQTRKPPSMVMTVMKIWNTTKKEIRIDQKGMRVPTPVALTAL